MNILFRHPKWIRTCDECVKYMFDDAGNILRRPLKIGLPVIRPPGVITPCHSCPKIPSDAPRRERQFAVELTDKVWQSVRFHMECRAVQRWPDDPIVRRNARIIQRIIDDVEGSPLREMVELMVKKKR